VQEELIVNIEIDAEEDARLAPTLAVILLHCLWQKQQAI